MLFRKAGIWQLADKIITYMSHDQEHTVYTGDISWWEAFAEMWEHVQFLNITDAVYTDEELVRYEHIKYMPEDFSHLYEHYIKTGGMLEDVELLPQHPFNIVILKNKEIFGLREKSEGLETTLDSILTEVIPSLLG